MFQVHTVYGEKKHARVKREQYYVSHGKFVRICTFYYLSPLYFLTYFCAVKKSHCYVRFLE